MPPSMGFRCKKRMEDEENTDEKRGELYVEKLNHFRCYFCKKWWSIGDAPKRRGWYCPWCGKYQEFRIMK